MEKCEEGFLIITFWAMVIITVSNITARYFFSSGILWGLEATVFLFAWLVIIGASYAVKKQLHLGIDILIAKASPSVQKILALVACGFCLFYAISLLVGSFLYWYPFVDTRAFLETNDIPMPDFLQFFAHWLNEGELYEKIPRFIPYFVLPFGMFLLTFRFLQVFWQVLQNKKKMIIAAHE